MFCLHHLSANSVWCIISDKNTAGLAVDEHFNFPSAVRGQMDHFFSSFGSCLGFSKESSVLEREMSLMSLLDSYPRL